MNEVLKTSNQKQFDLVKNKGNFKKWAYSSNKLR